MPSRLESAVPGLGLSLPVLALGGLLWLQLALALHPWWSDGSYYDYGWLVPPLAAWCLWARWETLPTPSRRLRGGPLPAGWLLLLAVAITGIAFLRLLERSDPLWRIPIWMHALTVAGLWHFLLHRLTGKSLYFLPVTILALTAVPLPPMIENALIRRLTELVLAYSVPVARALGMPVEMAGTALTAQGRVLQIDDGCSGIRSFQSLLMISVFFGEFFRLAWWKRLAMVASGIAAAFIFNGLRTVTLTWIFFERGEARFHEFHDFVGMVSFALSGVAVFWLASTLAGSGVQPGAASGDSHSQSENAAA